MNVTARLSAIICGIFFVTLFSVANVLACSCVVAGTVDEVFETTQNVVIMKLRSVEKLAEGEKGYGVDGIKQSILTVEKVFKGSLKVGQELAFAQGGGADCIWTFSEKGINSEYLFFIGTKPTKGRLWAAYACSRSNSTKYAAADLLYLDNLSKVRGKTRLSGTLTQEIDSPVEEVDGSYQRLAARKIRITGNGKNIELRTDKNGVYEIYDLPPGKYKVTPEKIFGFKFNEKNEKSADVEIDSKGHTEQDFDYSIDNAIGGKFFDANGKPLSSVCLKLLPARGNPARVLFELDCTDEKGGFRIDEIPAGTYIMVINEEGKVTSNEPFGTFYYPSAKRREDAAEITIGPGEFREDLIINAPETADTITISGFLTWDDGKRANDTNAKYAAVEFFAYKEGSDTEIDEDRYAKPDARAQVDDNGTFSIKILKGQKGKLLASMSTYEGKYENCPKMDKFVRKSGENIPTIKSPAIRIEAVGDLSEVEFIFPFPSCKIDKTDQ